VGFHTQGVSEMLTGSDWTYNDVSASRFSGVGGGSRNCGRTPLMRVYLTVSLLSDVRYALSVR